MTMKGKKTLRGMTLIEMIIAIVLMGVAMVMFSTALIPQIKDASTSHYQSRATALGHSMMSQILARNFDDYYDGNGGMLRCGETGADACSKLGRDGETSPSAFNDVDDYIGCWYTTNTKNDCPVDSNKYQLSDVVGNIVNNSYTNFRVEVAVKITEQSGTTPKMKQIQLDIFAGSSLEISLVSYRGNY
ncbi:MSHA pilin protein MshD [Vibrio harveyi]|uniref:type IV pilus modification PilV family protein n=1 Tax=Vibrio harveyi TaxID=669 RepID=UPI001EFD18BF|nr:prepilin-type N-terminal cleavage/methylation domain-containing protein [Vibrio harveyi]MCG9236296.1 prepilin-type N-terminal cleavage/methylation domain-containing protein [Vibrio harveyi]MCG9584820.1 prepilin-type N-terminal cleavage/methylation domain-containing protein [Vibrio harveyi]MCG9611638.1 prepilin-type N-terminal cleavage/methylation domain-containing protein [Vibrio harveyi]MCG9669745.1 prepilin-type N-terminal cleavage/methylation domain-containing protein [Vibrio harveyi]CAH